MNQRIRRAIKAAGITHWKVAEAMGISECTLSRKLRHELPADETERILEIIAQIAQNRKEGAR